MRRKTSRRRPHAAVSRHREDASVVSWPPLARTPAPQLDVLQIWAIGRAGKTKTCQIWQKSVAHASISAIRIRLFYMTLLAHCFLNVAEIWRNWQRRVSKTCHIPAFFHWLCREWSDLPNASFPAWNQSSGGRQQNGVVSGPNRFWQDWAQSGNKVEFAPGIGSAAGTNLIRIKCLASIQRGDSRANCTCTELNSDWGVESCHFVEGGWCCEGGLNSRPHPYQGCALPLSYHSICRGAGFSDKVPRAQPQSGPFFAPHVRKVHGT